MSLEKLTIFGSSSVGVYIYACDKYVLIPQDVPEKVERTAEEIFGVPVYRVSLCDSTLVGVFAAGNSKGLLLSRFVKDYELSVVKRVLGDEVIVEPLYDIRESALGNLILANDRAALVSPLIPKRALATIEDVLDVEVVQGEIAHMSLVGSLAVASNRGVLVCPLATDEELKALEELFKLPVDVGTVNRGSIFLRGGLVVNSTGGLVGEDTTGPELMRIQQVLFPSRS